MGGKMNEAAGTGADGTLVERRSDQELVITRSFDAPASLLYEAWTRPDLFVKWWAPRSTGMTILACDMDVRPGGGYRLEFGHAAGEQTMVFHGRYLDVAPAARLVWTNDETDQGAVTTVTFTERDSRTEVVLREAYPTKEALDESLQGMESCMPEQYRQLDDLLQDLARQAGR